MRCYYGLAVFTLGSNDATFDFCREDAYLIWADNLDEAHRTFATKAHEQEYATGTCDDLSYVKLAHLVDLALVDDLPGSGTMDLYSRHFASLETYREFEIHLGGRRPF
ncbi:hypothetical protein ABH922_003553 [Rhodococcus sp. 27YEA15]|uniref:DUF4288 domain-containing protein n=1 Tax=Rhodococcus sp. 27YEA15 TaxID=3156259 RepID=UPI003C7CE89C